MITRLLLLLMINPVAAAPASTPAAAASAFDAAPAATVSTEISTSAAASVAANSTSASTPVAAASASDAAPALRRAPRIYEFLQKGHFYVGDKKGRGLSTQSTPPLCMCLLVTISYSYLLIKLST